MAAAAAIEGHFVDIRSWSWTDGRHHDDPRPGLRARPRRRRHRPDHPQAVPQAGRAHRLRRVPLLRLGEGARLGPAAPPDPRHRQQLRLRLEPRARAVGAGGLRLPGDHRPSFADIFCSNCTKIGLLPVVLDEAACAAVAAAGEAEVDLDARSCAPAGTAPVRDRPGDPAPPAQRPRRHRADAPAAPRDRGLRAGARAHRPVTTAL